jgi:hypothetical protein
LPRVLDILDFSALAPVAVMHISAACFHRVSFSPINLHRSASAPDITCCGMYLVANFQHFGKNTSLAFRGAVLELLLAEHLAPRLVKYISLFFVVNQLLSFSCHMTGVVRILALLLCRASCKISISRVMFRFIYLHTALYNYQSAIRFWGKKIR